MTDKGNIKRVCSFCVSDWHFITMLIPYVHQKIEKQEEIKIYTEQSHFDAMRIFLSKLTLNQVEKQKLADLNWKASEAKRYGQIQKELEESKSENITFIVEGKNAYIERVNHYIEKWMNKNAKTNKKVTIVNCYEVMQFNQNIEEILEKHERILNTSGEKEVSEVFEKSNQAKGVS